MPKQRNRNSGQDQRTLEQALRETAQAKWQGRRCYGTNMSQALKAVTDVALHMGRAPFNSLPTEVRPADVKPEHIRAATARWYVEGLAPATINKRLNCLSAMGVSVEGCRVNEPKVLKWWLKPEDEARVCAWVVAQSAYGPRFAALVRWTTRTGLRIEESLRLRWSDVSLADRTVTVPGLKTASAQATLPFANDVLALLLDLGPQAFGEHEHVFGWTYPEAERLWRGCREFLGVQDNPTATLKALRRSAARHLHITKAMPLDMVRQYLRHEDISTTLSYLRLTGGYGTEEMRRFL